MRRLPLALLTATAFACGGSSGAPAGPGTVDPPAATSAATLSVRTISAVTELSTGVFRYGVTVTVAETGGRSAATVTSVRLSFTNGTRNGASDPITNAFTPSQIAANGTATSRRINLDDDNATASTLMNSVTATVNYTDDRGVAGTTTSGSFSVTPPTPTPAPASCTPGPGGTCMSMSRITVTCTFIPPGFEKNCSAVLPMHINTPITSGRITVQVFGFGDPFRTVVMIIPNTAPGAITVQIPSTRLGSGCGTSGIQNVLVNVVDGPVPGGRFLWGNSVEANVTCN
ncbi:MAG: hypothetical protein HY657_15275 [Acidobacteria bacterium]|nr:hypothetical protein [Acidobacteriota bacterium]